MPIVLRNFLEGVITIAAPIYDYTGKVIAALSWLVQAENSATKNSIFR